MTPLVRPFEASDLPGIYVVCARTDATGRTDPPRHGDEALPGHVYAGPYVAADPALTFVTEDEDGIAGYVSATDHTVHFGQWTEKHWWPPLRLRYPPDRRDPRDQPLVAELHAGPGPHRPWFDTHPAHLHIKVADRLQGKGRGRLLMDAVLAALHGRGAPGVHVGVAAANTKALAFYAALGFTEAYRHGWGHTLTLALIQRRPRRSPVSANTF